MIADSTYAIYYLIINETDGSKKYRDLRLTIPITLKNRVLGIVEYFKHANESSVITQFEDAVSEIFALRIEGFKWLATVNTASVIEVLLQEIEGLKRNVKDGELAESMRRSLHILEKVTLSISKSHDIENIATLVNESLPEVDGKLYKYMPVILASMGFNTGAVKSFMDFMHNSLAVEFSLILADLHTIGELHLRHEIVNELSHFLYDSTQKYGAYAIAFNIWTPDENDLSNEVTGCKILSQILLLEQGRNISISLDEILKP